MKKILLFIGLCFCLFRSLHTDAQGWQWAQSQSCNGGNVTGLVGIDKSSFNPGIYVVGYSYGLFGLDDSVCFSGIKFTAPHDTDQIFVVKYDTMGNVLWAHKASNGYCQPANITTDAQGNLLILGHLYSQTVLFGSHTIINPNYVIGGGPFQNDCCFIVKYDVNGNVLWTQSGGGVGRYDEYLVKGGIAVDAAQNIYVSGTFDDSLLTIGGHIFVNAHKDSGDIYLIKYDSAGNYIWGKTFGGIGQDYGERLLVGNNNKLYLSGWYSSSALIFGSDTLLPAYPSPSSSSLNSSYLIEMDTSGNTIWAKNSFSTFPHGLALDHENNVYIVGTIGDTSFNFGTFSCNNTYLPNGSFILKFDEFGNTLLGKTLLPASTAAGIHNFNIWEITADPCDNFWITGRLLNVDSVTTNDSIIIPTSVTGTDPMLFAGFNSSGALLQHVTFPSGGFDGAGLISDSRDKIYIAGHIRAITVVLGSDTLLTVGGSNNMFLAKYNPNLGCVIDNSIFGDSILCKGDSLLLSDATTGGTWSSSNVSVATVASGSGMVTGLSLGTAVITYSVGSGYVTKIVRVSPSPAMITGSGVFGDFLCVFSLPTTLSDTVSGGIWSSSNNSVASVGSTTGIVTYVGSSWGLDTIFYTISSGCYTSILIGGCEGVATPRGNSDRITLFPNPAKDELTITSSGKISGIKITNLLGQTVYSRPLAGGSQQVQVDVSAFPAGVYFVKINRSEVRKFVKE